MRNRPKLSLLLSLVLASLVSGCIWKNPYCSGASGLLSESVSMAPAPVAGPAPPGGETEAAAPALVPLEGGGLSRTVFAADTGTGFRVEARDLVIGPGQRASAITFPGSAVLELRSGAGRFGIGGEPREVRPGATFELPAGESLSVVNDAEIPIAIRVYVVIPR